MFPAFAHFRRTATRDVELGGQTIREGDTVDWWRVERIDRGRMLRLRAEMRVPGRAWIEFEVEPVQLESGEHLGADGHSPRQRELGGRGRYGFRR